MMKKNWNEKEIKELKSLYPVMNTGKLALHFGHPLSSVYAKAHALGLRKSEEFLRSPGSGRFSNTRLIEGGIRTRFKKGHIPANKGKRMSEYMSAESIEKSKATRFRKGHIPANHKPVGYERTTRDGYIEVKVAEPNVFRLKHRLIWEHHHGKIPPGHNVQFRDGNRGNTSIGNLYLISRSHQLKSENSMYARFPKEVQGLIKLKGALSRQINKINKK
ncbi:HNH endonuclease signature motif containing protein [Bacteroides pyogenes]|nr:HNH endonuclease signature motif containing protein [Bacteroides pyogenes]